MAALLFLLIHQAGSGSATYSGPQVFQSVESFQDQGLIRAPDGSVADYWRVIDGNIVRIRKLVIPTANGEERYDVIIIQQREGNLRTEGDVVPHSSSASVSWAPNFHTWVKSFWLEEYVERFGKKQPDILETAKAERDLYNGASTTIVITKENDLSQIQAMFRVVRKGNLPENQKLDIERGLGDAPILAPPTLKEVNGAMVAVGDYVELKSLIVKGEAEIDFLPYLILSLEASDLYAFGKRTIEMDGKTYPWGASTLLVEAPPAQARYYKRDFGFVEDRSRRKDKLAWLSIPLDDFLKALKDPERNKDRFTHPGLQNYLATPPLHGWNALPIISREVKLDPRYSTNPQLFSDPIKRILVTERKDIPIYRSSEMPQNDGVDFYLRRRPMLSHPFDPWKQIGFDAEVPPLRHHAIDGIHYFVFDPERVDYAEKYGGFFGGPIETQEDVYRLYGGPYALTRLDDPIINFGIHLHAVRDFAAFKRAKAQAFGIELEPAERRYVPEKVQPVDRHTIIERHQEMIRRGFADTRYDYDAGDLSQHSIASEILRNPFENYSDLGWAIQHALSHRLQSTELEQSLSEALLQLLPSPIHGTYRLELDEESQKAELKRQDEWIEKIFSSLREIPLQDEVARRILASNHLVRGFSRTRLARLFVEWGLQNSKEFIFAYHNAFGEPDLTLKFFEAIENNPEYQSHFMDSSSLSLVREIPYSFFSLNNEPTPLDGIYGPRDPVFGETPMSSSEAMKKMDRFLDVLKHRDVAAYKEFKRLYGEQLRNYRLQHASPLRKLLEVCRRRKSR